MPDAHTIDDIELKALLDGMLAAYGYDFRNYARSSLRRRVRARVDAEGVESIAALLDRVLRDPEAFGRLLDGLTINVTAMFRDPTFFRALREKVVPHLRSWPFVRAWVAGCSTGEEVYSLAIVLHEAGLTDRALIYATDVSDTVLARAAAGIYRLDNIKQYTANYLASGGTEDFSRYYTADHDHAIMASQLRRAVTFARHNLVSDASFNEFTLICCRNVLIYFDGALHARVHRLLRDSLARFGFLALGHAESLRFSAHEDDYTVFDAKERIYQRKP